LNKSKEPPPLLNFHLWGRNFCLTKDVDRPIRATAFSSLFNFGLLNKVRYHRYFNHRWSLLSRRLDLNTNSCKPGRSVLLIANSFKPSCKTRGKFNRESFNVSWLSRGPDSSGEVWIGYKRLILKLSGVLLAMEVEGPYMHPNQRLILIQKWYDTRDIQLTFKSPWPRSSLCHFVLQPPRLRLDMLGQVHFSRNLKFPALTLK